MKSQGQWNAYVLRGKDKAMRKARLEEVPEEMRKAAESHVRTVFAIQRYHKLQKLKNR